MYKYLIGIGAFLVLAGALAIQTQRIGGLKEEARGYKVSLAAETAKRTRDREHMQQGIRIAQGRSAALTETVKELRGEKDAETREWLDTRIPDRVQEVLQ